jgi:hypothetical protein
MAVNAEFERRVSRVKKAIGLGEPDRVPVIPVMGAFPIYYGGSTVRDVLYDYRKGEACFDTFFRDFKPDLGWDPGGFYPAQFLETLGVNWLRWPGNQIEDPNGTYQYLEGEYMKRDEYGEASFDPTHFMLTKWIPRSFRHLRGLEKLNFRNAMWQGFLGTFSAFSDQEVVQSFQRCIEAGQILGEWMSYLDSYRRKMEENLGIPVAAGGFAFAPFDMVGDTMRGTEAVLIDMLEKPTELLELIAKVADFAIQDQISAFKRNGRPWIWFWLHKGVDEFMSDEQYARFYWPSLQHYLVELIDAGLTPVVYCEGRYDSRLKHLREVPTGKVVYDFELVDMAKAKEMLGDVACIAGNVPNVLLTHGTKQEVIDYTKRLIDTCAPGGGFMLDSGAVVDDAKAENLMAMFETAELYGKSSR